MNETKRIENQINQYLNAVRENLFGLSNDEIDSIIDDLREHIDKSLQAHGGQPTLENTRAVLAEMDPPESFAPDFEATSAPNAKVSRLAIIGAVLLPFGIVAALLLLVPVSSTVYSAVDGVAVSSEPQVAWWQWVLRFTVLPLGAISPFATTILGLMSISQIRASKGRLIGKPLALLDALFYPLLVLDGLLITLMFGLIGTIPSGNLTLTELLSVLSYIVVILVDLMIVAVAWRKIR